MSRTELTNIVSEKEILNNYVFDENSTGYFS